MAQSTTSAARSRRKKSIRKRVAGSEGRPRLTVFRSNKHIYAQVIDDMAGKTLAAASSLAVKVDGKKVDAATAVGEAVAQACSTAGVQKVVFDRNGYIYHGRVRALADGARKGGLEF
jgi:large subunit ribosomal protein L18